jgi:hypothetical protein
VNNGPSLNVASFECDLLSLCILMIRAKKQEVGSDHLAIVAEFAFTLVEDESEKEDESEGEVRTARHIYFSSDSESG